MRRVFASLLVFSFLTACGAGGGGTIPPRGDRVAQTPSQAASIGRAVRGRLYYKQFAAMPDPDQIADADIDANIEPAMQGNDRAALRAVMLHLHRTERKNVVLITGGRAIANHHALLDGATLASEKDGMVRLGSGEMIAAPPWPTLSTDGVRRALGGPIPPSSDNSGPFHRSYDASDGYSYISASPSIPCNASPFMTTGATSGPYRDTGYIYFGNSTYHDAYEGGMYYEASQTTNDYRLYQTDQTDGAGFFILPAQYTLGCGQNASSSNITMTMNWAIDATDLLTTHWRGYNRYNQIIDVTVTRTPAGVGWYDNCSTCTVSTMTTIAQSLGGPYGYWPDGWSFGASPNSFNPSIGWYGMKVGHCHANSSTSTDCYIQPDPGPVPFHQSFPTDQNQVLVGLGDNRTYWSERVGIALATDTNLAPNSPLYDGLGNAEPPSTTTPPPKGCVKTNTCQ